MSNVYRIELATIKPEYDSEAREVLHNLKEYGVENIELLRSIRVFTLAGGFSLKDAEKIAREFLCDSVIDMFFVNSHVISANPPHDKVIEIIRRPGVMDPSETSVIKGARELGFELEWIRTSKKYIVSGAIEEDMLEEAAHKVLANDVIEEVAMGEDGFSLEEPASNSYKFEKTEVSLSGLDDEALLELSRTKQLYLSLEEMKTIKEYFEKLGRTPTDIELETLAQTWSEHCVHKTFRGKIRYTEEGKETEMIDNLLKNTVAKATNELAKDWCLSVFVDNAGVIEFDDKFGAVFKAETHNHPSAIEPYGGAGTGIGGVIRDPMGTGLGAKPVMNTDVFCFGSPDYPQDKIPKGTLHPMRIMKGVVAGVRDYGNRMGIPTSNGSIYFDDRYIGNPLVFCGNVAMVPREMANKRTPTPGQLAIVVGGRTGRDGIHGATFSSVELDENSEMVSSGAVQIGNPIEEKKVRDFILRARDAGLYTCITDCGAGGLSSALGEMGETCGIKVELDKVPLKYDGLNYTEIWISEAQERMVFSANQDKLKDLKKLAKEENIELTVVGEFTTDKMLRLFYNNTEVCVLDMDFLHDGIPQIEREGYWKAPEHNEPQVNCKDNYGEELKSILASWNVCSKEWVIRQYDHEVQANSVIKPLVGEAHDGPGDAAVVTPILGSKKALAVSNGMNPKYSDIDPYHMAASAIDEALRNIVAVGGSLERCALLDNFCWGNTDKPDRLGGLVRAARACYDVAKAYGVPFISGKDSLNNEYATEEETIVIPGTLLVSAMAVMEDCTKATTMDVKGIGNSLYIVGMTKKELGASHYFALKNEIGNNVPQVDTDLGKKIFDATSAASNKGIITSAHDCSEGGIAVAAAEMSFAGELGISIDLENIPVEGELATAEILFSESNSRLIFEIKEENRTAFETLMQEKGVPFARIGDVTEGDRVVMNHNDKTVIDEAFNELKLAWKAPLAL